MSLQACCFKLDISYLIPRQSKTLAILSKISRTYDIHFACKLCMTHAFLHILMDLVEMKRAHGSMFKRKFQAIKETYRHAERCSPALHTSSAAMTGGGDRSFTRAVGGGAALRTTKKHEENASRWIRSF
ncbi:hypothetical protein P168DRAFT_301159 [Aspergillus campestris IBT 28561]|uniref:Uncharacterized protein n=1 Tax=Aspergillus campestris (strain IBT 28561) TaxID=1392248 RepID=A0A2I1DF14_ASPC2|nr:uncharacterized protein P168DRAFT_301159 [Aspergillus campestris IBT 28561]PKY08466.1 hypothetical protein P168DRAFT_301159 [Aspergillus campestris IBT 28561]